MLSRCSLFLFTNGILQNDIIIKMIYFWFWRFRYICLFYFIYVDMISSFGYMYFGIISYIYYYRLIILESTFKVILVIYVYFILFATIYLVHEYWFLVIFNMGGYLQQCSTGAVVQWINNVSGIIYLWLRFSIYYLVIIFTQPGYIQ